LPSAYEKRIKIKGNKIILEFQEWADVLTHKDSAARFEKDEMCKLTKEKRIIELENLAMFVIPKIKDRGLAYKCINEPKGTNCNKLGLLKNIKITGENYYQQEIPNPDPAKANL
jgi:hypothetical protein